MTFVSGELRALDERLSRIEEELGGPAQLLETPERQLGEPERRPDRVAPARAAGLR